MNPQEYWEILEKIEAYVSGEFEGEEAREAERLILDDPENLRLVESYTRMLAAFSTLAEKSPHAPTEVVDQATRWVYLSEFIRQTNGQ